MVHSSLAEARLAGLVMGERHGLIHNNETTTTANATAARSTDSARLDSPRFSVRWRSARMRERARKSQICLLRARGSSCVIRISLADESATALILPRQLIRERSRASLRSSLRQAQTDTNNNQKQHT